MADRSKRTSVRVEMAHYDRASQHVQQAVRRAVDRALTRAKVDAETTVPPRNRTGHLKGSMYVETNPAGDGRVLGEVGNTADYARWVEEGTRRNRAYPYLRPAAEKAARGIEAELRDEIGDKL